MFTKDTRIWLLVWGGFIVILFGSIVMMRWLSIKTDDNVRSDAATRETADAIERLRERDKAEEIRNRVPVPETDDEGRMYSLVAFVDALESYRLFTGSYPVASGEGASFVLLDLNKSPCTELFEDEYIEYCPRDPMWPNRFFKYRSIAGAKYELTAILNDDESQYCLPAAEGCLFSVETGLVRVRSSEGSILLPIRNGILPSIGQSLGGS